MHSIHHRGVTVVTLVILFFTPVFRHHHWVDVLTGVKTETSIVQCEPHDPCPAHRVIVQKVELPAEQR